MEQTNFPTSYIHTVDFGHIYTLALALCTVQNLDLDALVALPKSVFDSPIHMRSLATGLLKPSLSGTFFSANISKPWTSSFKASIGLDVLGGFLVPVFNLCLVYLSPTVSQGVFLKMVSRTHFPQQQKKSCVASHHWGLPFQL